MTTSQTADQRVARSGLDLPAPPAPMAAFEPCVRVGSTVYVSGQIAFRERLFKITVFVASTLTDQPRVADAAPELLLAVFGRAGTHARSAVGVVTLPLGTPVEIEAIAELCADAR